MIDPITAFATAQAAVAGIQKAIKLGKDINGLIGEFGKFFDAKDTLEKAANDNAKSGKTDTQLAMEIVGQRNQLREMEEHLKHTLIYTGYPEMWEQMLIERAKIRQAREKAEREARKAAALRKQRLVEGLLYGLIAMLFAALIIGTVYILMQV